jgi:hypothetical protein
MMKAARQPSSQRFPAIVYRQSIELSLSSFVLWKQKMKIGERGKSVRMDDRIMADIAGQWICWKRI